MPDWIVKYWVQWLFGLVIAALTAYCKYLSGIIKKERKEQKAIRDGMRALLRRQIIFDCESAISVGYCSTTNKDTIDSMYKSYSALGGNGVVTTLREQMMALPTVREGINHELEG